MIQLHQIEKTYPDGTPALRGVDLTLDQGMFGLLGPNGAGKTTLLSILVLALEPSRGRRVYAGVEDRARQRSRLRGQIGYLAQDFRAVAVLSGFEYLMYCGELRQVPLRRAHLRQRVHTLLDAVGLSHAGRRAAGSYSGGMMRRLGLAQALMHAPKYLVVDEPTAGLDPEERIHFRHLMTELADEIPVLLSTHIVEDVEATCQRLGILAAGRMLFDGEPGELLHQVEGCLWSWPAAAPVPPEAREIALRSGAEGVNFRVLYARRPPAGGEPLEPSLEDAYAVYLSRTTNAESDAA